MLRVLIISTMVGLNSFICVRRDNDLLINFLLYYLLVEAGCYVCSNVWILFWQRSAYSAV